MLWFIITGKGTSDSSLGGVSIDTACSSKVLSVIAEPFGSSVFFPCKQYLTDKADSVFIYITVPAGQVAVSNGLLKEKINMPGNKVQFKWESRYPIAYYLIFFGISDYTEYSYRFFDPQFNDSVFFQNFIYKKPGFLESSKPDIDITVQIIKLYEKLTGVAYPFRKEKYGHVTSPISGGMENQTMTMLYNYNFELVAHELGHSWFGDLVTCSDWQNIWINEGFASYMEYLALEHMKPGDEVSWLKSALIQVLYEPEGTVFVPENLKWNDTRIFNTALTYKKGAYILHMLRKNINNDAIFFNILKSYLTKYAYSNASADDFMAVAENVYGSGLHEFFRQWFYGRGYPVVRFYWSVNNNSLNITTRSKGSSELSPLFNFDLEVLVHFETGDSVVKLAISDSVMNFKFKFQQDIKSIIVNPGYDLLANVIAYPPVMNSNTDVHLPERNFSVLPNPFTDSAKIYFENANRKRTIEIIDRKGDKVGSWNCEGKEFTITPGMLKPGTYIICVTDEYGNSTEKIIKK